MRICFILLLAVIVLLVCPNTASGAAIKLRAAHADVEKDSGRVLLADAKTEKNEERAKLSLYLKYQTAFVMSKRIENALMKKKIIPDDFWYGLKLDNLKVRWNSRKGYTTNYKKWVQYQEAYKTANPAWKSNLPPGL
ncbi:hypothetical protein JG688_00016774 [Phytophthora aleatoria]|uniref:RxLR effector protein n=1 Tax=Phytophthora aleatoria TaxID=2496075 RepID=A0A8J5IDK8_9STRA|nr:hypothetical protein JG688_00016774 [Phytophthora aleatoria]